jgi:hypothetical protein
MILQQFNILSKESQQDVLLKTGIFLAERTDGPFRVMLYQLDSFYVEVYFYNKYNKVAFFKAFESTDALQPYLKTIDVSSLLQEVFS